MRSSQPVIRLSVGMVTLTEEAAGFSASNMISPLNPEYMPQVVEKPRWLYSNTTWLWLLSSTYFSDAAMAGAAWAFDAVYTPADTRFLQDAAAEGATLIPGYELFFYQGVHAWAHFSGAPLDEARLRADLRRLGDAA